MALNHPRNELHPNYFQVQGERREKNPLLLVLMDDAILDNEQTCSLRTGEVCQEGMVITIN